MGLRKCCVGNCPSTTRTHRLFFIPKDDHLRQLWLSFLVPTNVELSGLRKEQLVEKCVCQNHFDRHQFDRLGNRLPNGYPCLFSAKEIAYGIPLSSTVGDHLSDHNYFMTTALESNDDAIAIEVQGIPENMETETNRKEVQPMMAAEETVRDFLSDHIYFLPNAGESDIGAATIGIGAGPSNDEVPRFQVPKPVEIEINEQLVPTPMVAKATDSPKISGSCPKKPVKQSAMKKNAQQTKSLAKCTCFIKKMKKQALAVHQKPFRERLAKAEALNQDHSFLHNFDKLNKQAQNFLIMQLKSVKKNKKGVRFTDDEKLLALTLMKESPKGYRLLQKIFKLPSKRTLNRLAEKITFGVGINENIFRLFERRCVNWDTKKKICSIVFDEVALTPHLTYVESRNEITGFKDLGKEKFLKFADHALVFMLRGVCSNWKQPISYYFCEGTTSAPEVKTILKEVVAKVSQSGLVPVALVCDQGTTFRSALKMLRQETEQKRNLEGQHDDGTVEICQQNLSVVFDPPHLLKGLRNNLLTKNMIFNGSIATWDDILTVYKADCQLGHTRMNKKLTDHHVIASKIKKMKVSVAAQVFSEQTSAMLKYTSLYRTTVSGEEVSSTMRTTGEAVGFIDQLFDSVNGSKRSAIRGKLRGPVKPTSEHFSFWREAIKTLENIKFVDSASKRALMNKKEYYVRVPSLDGWVTTLKSFERIAKLLFDRYELKYFYPRLINQDPLENFFGRIRAINYRNVNPDSYTFVNSFKSLLISNVMGPHSIYSNCEEDNGETIVDFLNLLKEDVDTDNKENAPVDINFMPRPATFSSSHLQEQGNSKITLETAINEKIRVHSSAYTAGYLCRKVTKKFNCIECQKTYSANKHENIHKWIVHREYKKLKNSNLAYPSKHFVIAYRDISNIIHNNLNKYAHSKNIGILLKNQINTEINLDWLGCTTHKVSVTDFYVNLIMRLHIHNWCNIINKILRGDIQEKYVLKMSGPQIMAYNKYKIFRLRNKSK